MALDVTPYLDLKPAPRTIFDHLDARRDRVRYQVPAGGGWRPVTWADHAAEIEELALFLASSDLRPGERAAIFAPNRVEWMSAALAIQTAGGVMVPVYPSCTAEQAGYVIGHSDARVVFVDTQALLDRLASAGSALHQVRRIVLFDDELTVPATLAERTIRWSRARGFGAARRREDPGARQRLLDAIDLDAPGLMLYTSGTSGDPKGVPLTHRNVGVNGRDWLRNNAPLLDEDASDLLWLPLSHIFGFGEACLGNTLGFTSWLATPLDVLARLPEVRPSVFMSVPVVWDKLAALAAQAGDDPGAQRARLAELTGGRLQMCLSGGAGLSQAVKERFLDAGILIIEGYGLTEAAPTLTLNRPDAFRFDSVGKPVPSVELKLAEDGEILARGANVFGGYHKDPEATAATFTEDGWLRTGDVGRFTEDGFLQIVDRKKDILVTAGGKNVAPANIERRFADDPLVAHAVVYGEGKRFLVAGIWPTAPGTPDLESRLQDSVERVNAGLARFETVKRFAVMDEPLSVEGGLLTPTLKVKRRAVVERFRDRLEALYS